MKESGMILTSSGFNGAEIELAKTARHLHPDNFEKQAAFFNAAAAASAPATAPDQSIRMKDEAQMKAEKDASDQRELVRSLLPGSGNALAAAGLVADKKQRRAPKCKRCGQSMHAGSGHPKICDRVNESTGSGKDEAEMKAESAAVAPNRTARSPSPLPVPLSPSAPSALVPQPAIGAEDVCLLKPNSSGAAVGKAVELPIRNESGMSSSLAAPAPGAAVALPFGSSSKPKSAEGDGIWSKEENELFDKLKPRFTSRTLLVLDCVGLHIDDLNREQQRRHGIQG